MESRNQEQAVDRVNALKTQLGELRTKCREVEDQLNKEVETLQRMCTHNYEAEDDGDYHRPSYYYVCTVCNHFTRNKKQTR